MNSTDREEFILFLKNCTDRQIQGVYEKESKANRREFVALVVTEAAQRGLVLDDDFDPGS